MANNQETKSTLFTDNTKKDFYKGAQAFVTIEGIETEYEDNKIPVKSFKLVEQFCKLYELDITLDGIDDILDFQTIGNVEKNPTGEKVIFTLKKITLEIIVTLIPTEPKKDIRVISGTIVDFNFQYSCEENSASALYLLNLRVKPSLFQMDREKKKFIFTKENDNNTIEKICKDVLKRNEIKEESYKFNFVKQEIGEKELSFVTQYEETDFSFLIRILQENNLYYFLHYDLEGNEFLNIGEDNTNIMVEEQDVFEIQNIFTVQKSFEQIIYPIIKGGISNESFLPHLHLPSEKTPLLSSSLRKMVYPGKKISVKGLFGKDATSEMLVIATNTIFQTDDKNACSLAHEVMFYPLEFGLTKLKKINKPKVLSSQFALVVGKEEEESSAQKDAMVSIQLFWDDKALLTEDQSSTTYPVLETTINAPVSQLFGGVSGDSGYCGSWFLPRVGQKVIVHFLNGDTDFPLITGVVYDEKNISPYEGKETDLGATQFSIKTCTTPNKQNEDDNKTGHEFTFVDKMDEQKILLSSSRDLLFDVSNDTKLTVTKNFSTLIKEGDITSEITKGNHEITLTEGNYTLSVKKGNLEITVNGGDITIKTDGNLNLEATKDISFKGKNINFEASATFAVKGNSVSVEASQDVGMKSGTACAVEGGTSTTIKGGTALEAQAPNVSLKADIKLDLEGTLANLTGSGPTAIKGALVQVN